MARVLAISSHVARGHVGLAATVPALQWLGHEVWALPTVVLASRPGLGHFVKHDLPPPDLGAMLAALEADGCWPSLDAVFTGYFPSRPVGCSRGRGHLRASRQANANVLVMVDPILGDAGRLYVAEETAEAIRDELLPLASIATPNLFELQWLTGASCPRSTTSRGPRGAGTAHGGRDVRAANAGEHRNAAGDRHGSVHRARHAPRARAFPTARATCSPGCCSATCSTGNPRRRRSRPACKTSIACWRPARGSRSCSSPHSCHEHPMTAPNMREKLKGALAFFHHEAAGGLVLVVAALVALLASNSPLAGSTTAFSIRRSACASARSRSTSRCCTGSTTA